MVLDTPSKGLFLRWLDIEATAGKPLKQTLDEINAACGTAYRHNWPAKMAEAGYSLECITEHTEIQIQVCMKNAASSTNKWERGAYRKSAVVLAQSWGDSYISGSKARALKPLRRIASTVGVCTPWREWTSQSQRRRHDDRELTLALAGSAAEAATVHSHHTATSSSTALARVSTRNWSHSQGRAQAP